MKVWFSRKRNFMNFARKTSKKKKLFEPNVMTATEVLERTEKMHQDPKYLAIGAAVERMQIQFLNAVVERSIGIKCHSKE